MRTALVCGVATLFGYALSTLIMLVLVSGEVAGGVFAYGVYLAPVACLVGGLAGALMSKSGTGKVITAGLAIGFLLPPGGYFAAGVISEGDRLERNAALHREAIETMERAKADGFPFPPDVKPFLPGDVRSDLPLEEVVRFYDEQTRGGWKRFRTRDSVWYVRNSRSPGMIDRIRTDKKYSNVPIYFETFSQDEMKLSVVEEFATLVTKGDWTGASRLCTAELQKRMGASALKSRFVGFLPSPAAFKRSYFPNGATAPIAVNTTRVKGSTTPFPGEVGFELTSDLIPQIKSIEF